jgi:2'-5' RNA ligase
MSVIRAFIAIDLTSEIRQRLDEVAEIFKNQLPSSLVRWVPAKNIHLTVKFLGDVSISNLPVLNGILQTEAVSHHSFEISVGGSGAFPTNRRPRVIWVGVEAPAELGAIQVAVENALARIGYAREERAFSPHLTLGRVSRNASSTDLQKLTKVLEATKIGFLGVACVEEICLYRSDLKPTGSVYTRLFAAPFGVNE